MSERYIKPGWFTRTVFNPFVASLTRAGVSVWGSRVLRVRGRKSGEWRSAPVNLLSFEGKRYLVAPRGQTQWVRNIRVSHEGELWLGSKVEPIRVTEVPDSDRVPMTTKTGSSDQAGHRSRSCGGSRRITLSF